MKAATLAARHTIEQEMAVYAKPRLIAEWEYNRFQIPTATVVPAQTGDTEWVAAYGDIDSIALPNRPRTGIAKARADSIVRPAGKYRDTPSSARFYPSGQADFYDYFSCVQHSSVAPDDAGQYEFDAPIIMTVTYPEVVEANKVVVGFETSYCKPTQYSVQVSVDGTGWFTVGTDAPLDADGRATFWYNGTTWGFDTIYDQVTEIRAVRLTVFAVDHPFAHVDVLQVGARLENDLTDFLVDYSTQLEVADRSFIAPMGKASANQATVTLSNIDGRFSNENADSLYAGMIDKRVRFTLDLGINTTAQGGAGYEYIREFTMWADVWGTSGTSQTNLEVQLKDSAALLQEMTMPTMFMENVSVGAVIWTIMDRLGLTNYSYTRLTADTAEVLSYYWPDVQTDVTVWDEISALAEGTQTAVYFDEHDVMQIRPRQAMYSDRTVDWNFDAVQNGTKMPDIVSVEAGNDLEVNQVDITYKPAYISDDQNGFPKMEQVWTPENTTAASSGHTTGNTTDNSTVTLRSAPLIAPLLAAGTIMSIPQAVVEFWPYESDINIEGEILHYKAKEYLYYRADGALTSEFINSLDDKNNRDTLNVNLNWKNHFSGRLAVTARALYGSQATDHTIVKNAYTQVLTSWENDVFKPWTGNVVQNAGYVTMSNPVGPGWPAQVWDHVYHLRKSGDVVLRTSGSNAIWYGTKIRLPNTAEASLTANGKLGGIWFAGDWGDAGWFLEVCATSQIDGWEKRQWRHELCLFAMPGDARVVQVPADVALGGDPKGFQHTILDNTWYAIDVLYQHWPGLDAFVSVYLDGVFAGSWRVDAAHIPLNEGQGRFGTFVRGPSTADYEYLYAFAQDATNPAQAPDSTAFLDLVSGGFTSGFVEKEIKYNFRNINPSYRWPTGTVYFPQRIDDTKLSFDEFGPQVHEVRKFNVTFDNSKSPVVSSYLYLSNEGQVTPLYYQSDAFSAEFMLANSSRDNTIVNGDDTITFGADNSVTQTMFVYGRSVYQDTEKTISKQDAGSVRKRGPSKTTFDSRYVESDDLANSLADFVVSLWAGGVDEITLTGFGNPLVQLGDLVTINYPVKGMTPATHKYFVVQIQGNFKTGYTSQYTLRRARV